VTLARLLAALALGLAPAAALPAPYAAAATCGVTVQLAGYDPNPKRVTVGATVTWCWNEDNHSVTFSDGPDSDVRNQGATYPRKFTATGTFAYHCKKHSSMHGSVIVTAATTAPPSKTPSPTPSHTPTPTRTVAPTTQPPTTPPATRTPTPTTAAPTTAAPTTAPATSSSPPSESATPSETETALPLAEPPAKSRTGIAVAIAALVALGGLGGATALWLRSRRP
jgi:plastocyanin